MSTFGLWRFNKRSFSYWTDTADWLIDRQIRQIKTQTHSYFIHCIWYQYRRRAKYIPCVYCFAADSMNCFVVSSHGLVSCSLRSDKMLHPKRNCEYRNNIAFLRKFWLNSRTCSIKPKLSFFFQKGGVYRASSECTVPNLHNVYIFY